MLMELWVYVWFLKFYDNFEMPTCGNHSNGGKQLKLCCKQRNYFIVYGLFCLVCS